jgi:hypothetical protein
MFDERSTLLRALRATEYEPFATRRTCPYRKSNPYVLMVQPSKNGPPLDAPGALNKPSNRRILA